MPAAAGAQKSFTFFVAWAMGWWRVFGMYLKGDGRPHPFSPSKTQNNTGPFLCAPLLSGLWPNGILCG